MFKELLESIVELADDARETERIDLPGGRKVLLIKRDGSAEAIEVPPPAHAEVLRDPTELARFVKEEMEGDAILYLDANGVKALYDKGDRRDHAIAHMAFHPQWSLVTELQKGKEYQQREFFRLLRVALDGCLPDPDLLARVKQIKWNDSDSGTSSVSQTHVGMGRQLVREVGGVDALPDVVTLILPIWQGIALAGYRRPIRCAVETNPDTRALALTPFPGEVQKALDDALNQLRDDLQKLIGEEDSRAIYLGRANGS